MSFEFFRQLPFFPVLKTRAFSDIEKCLFPRPLSLFFFPFSLFFFPFFPPLCVPPSYHGFGGYEDVARFFLLHSP